MYEFLNQLLKDHEDGIFTFEALKLAHFVYLFLIIGGIALVIFLLKGKSMQVKQKAINITVNCALGLYILDFFLMPFSYGYIDIDKLPFHICTLMSVMCFISRHNKFFGRFKTSFSMMGLIGALMYLTYPSGVASADGYSYRIVQTVLYHGLMIAQGVFSLAFEDIKLEWKKSYLDLLCLCAMSLWAVIGNYLYSGTVGEYSHSFNWFFVVNDPFGLLSEQVSKFVMPFGIVIVFFIMDILIYLIYFGIKKLLSKKQSKEC